MRNRLISIDDLNQLRVWIETKPEVPAGEWCRDFGCFQDPRRGIVAEDISVAQAGREG
jgi:hypothetical protein